MRSASDSSGTSIGSLSAIEIAVPPWSTLLKLPLVTPLLGLETSVPNPGGVKQVSGDGNALDQPARAFHADDSGYDWTSCAQHRKKIQHPTLLGMLLITPNLR